MSKIEDGCYGSLKGIALIAKVLAGRCRMHYTRVAAGKGMIPEDLTPKTLEKPPEYVMDAIISAVTNPVDGECQVSVQINSANVENGFYCTWLILYAEDPDEGEVPFTALCLENEPEWIRPSSSIVGKLAHFDIIAAVGDVDNVTATIDPDAIVTYAVVKQLIKDATAVLEITVPKDGWTDNAEGGPGLRVDIPISGVTDAMQPHLSIHPAYLGAAENCGFSTASRTLDGALRVYAQAAPAEEMTATLTLLCATSDKAGGGIVSGGGGSAVPENIGKGLTYTADGKLSVKIGDGLKFDKSDAVAVDGSALSEEAAAALTDALTESDENAAKMIDEVYG